MWPLEEIKRMNQPSADTRAVWGNAALDELEYFDWDLESLQDEELDELDAWEEEYLCPHGIPWDEVEAEPRNCIDCWEDSYADYLYEDFR